MTAHGCLAFTVVVPTRWTGDREAGPAMRSVKIIGASGLALASFAVAPTVSAPTAAAGCVKSSGITVCDQDDAGKTGPVVPYPCDLDWYCYDGSTWDLGIDVAPSPPPDRPDIGRPGRPDVGRPGTPGNRPGGGGGGGLR